MTGIRRRYILTSAILLALAATTSVAYASVFVFYPGQVNIYPVEPPVVFVGGDNANQTDLAGNTIEVYIGANSTSLTMNLHPTYQTTYYYNVSLINNTDPSNIYYVWVKVDSTNISAGVSATLVLNASGVIYTLDLGSTGNPVPPGIGIELNPGDTIMLNVKVQITEGIKLPSTPYQVNLSIIYSPENTFHNITP